MNFFKIFFATLSAIVVSILLLLVISVGWVAGTITSMLSSSQGIKSESVLVVDLSETIVDTPNINPLSMIDFSTLTIQNQITTLDAIRAIESAASDDKIKGIYIRPSVSSRPSLAVMEEIRAEIERFKMSGKFVVAYSDIFSQGGYYLASIADSIYLQPEGMVVWQGVGVSSQYYKGLLDKLNVEVEVFRPSTCSYKSAVEPLTRSNMSPESREQSEALVESLWSSMVSDVAKARQLTPSLLNKTANLLSSFISSETVTSGLIDKLIYEDEVESIFESLGVELNDNNRANRVSLSRYITNQKLLSSLSESSNNIAVIYAEGAIVDGEGEIGDVGGDALAKVLREVREDDDIKSVVLRVNSPGGSALASDVIWREMSLLRRVKPLVVSMGSYAASGGYYISAPADAIIADKFTITGSIGVYGVLFNIEKGLSSKLGITTDGAKSNPSADFMRSSRPINATERAVMSRSVDQVYNTFTSHVSSGRNLPIQKVLDIAQGRVWSGADALNLGLVDAIGGIKTAILIAAERGGVANNFSVVEKTTIPDDLTALFAPFASIFTNANQYLEFMSGLKPLKSQSGVVMFSPLRFE